MYGNIGTADRLDFTVIGPAVNLLAPRGAVPRARARPAGVRYFAGMCACADYRSLGTHVLPGISRPVEVFTVPEAA